MNILIWFIKLGRVLLALVGVFRRMLCCFRRRRRNSDTPLPVTVKDGDVHHIQSLPVDSGDAIQPWTSWDDGEGPSGITVVGGNVSNRSAVIHNGVQRSVSESSEPEIDFFQDMTPEFRRTDKILLRKPETSYDSMEHISISNRFAADSHVPPVTSTELGQWCDEEVGWEDSLNTDIDYHADIALRESKIKERERRAAENLRRKQAKDAMRNFKKDHLATKLS